MGSTVARRLQRPVAVFVTALLVGVTVVLPISRVAFGINSQSMNVLARSDTWILLGRTFTLALCVTAMALVIGVPLGALFARARLVFRRLLLAIHALPLFLPPLVVALGWFHLFGERGLIGSPRTSALLFGPLGMVLILTTAFVPVVTFLTMLGILGLDPSLEEAAVIAAQPARVVRRILIPAALPQVTFAALIVFALAVAEVGVPMFLRVNVYGASVFARLGGVEFSPGEAAALSLPMIGVALVLVLVERKLTNTAGSPRLRTTARMPLNLGHGPTVFVALAAFVSLAPLVAICARGVSGLLHVSEWLGANVTNSLVVSGVAALVATFMGIVTGESLARGCRSSRVLDVVLVAAFFVPSAVLGTGLVGTWNRPATQWVYGSLAIVVLPLVARYSALAVRTFAASVGNTSRNYDEAAAIAGANYVRRMTRLVIPMHTRSLIAAFGLVLVFCLRDLESTVMFYPPGGETLTVRLFTLEANGPQSVVAAIALIQITLTLGIIGLGVFSLRKVR